ncbi:MAG: GIY-YIG nuclease family protein [Saprospirales bacterium]|nr:GIY-YIG nuclease family protein [Saprospirales bacterium]MBK8491625.1 GIY-YIG nuclease family protein [Saprospirales bacterium]MBK8491626.1 GIY-YIG nuclease family protein [Saprospirales bacterium]MBK8491627.1 GIY-YIG nuclease family protein [Saprospirales bacterium]
MPCVYILYSTKLDRFYIGAADDPFSRLQQHNDAIYPGSFSAKGIPWSLFFYSHCIDWHQALAIERHIKKMKSRTFIHNLKKFPHIILRLKHRFPPRAC